MVKHYVIEDPLSLLVTSTGYSGYQCTSIYMYIEIVLIISVE